MGSFGSPEADRLERLEVDSFDGGRLRRSGTWAVCFLAVWCPFCRAFGPRFAGLATELRTAVADLSDLESPLWEAFAIDVVPTVVVFHDGVPVYRRDGVPGQGLGEADLVAIRHAVGRP